MQCIVNRADENSRLKNALDSTHVVLIIAYFYYFTDLLESVEFYLTVA
jgi:hypothetical protein